VTLHKFNRSAHARNIGSLIGQLLYRVKVVGAHHVSSDGIRHEVGVIVICSGVGSAGMLLIKSILRRPSHVLTDPGIPEIGGDFPLNPPYSIEAQLASLEVVLGGGVIVMDAQMLDPGFLIMQSQARVVPVSLWVNKSHGEVSEWQGKAPAMRSSVNVYFGQGKEPPEAGLIESEHGGLIGASRYMSEWCRQLLQDHRQMVLHRLGGEAAR
jgi:hypothetical protein